MSCKLPNCDTMSLFICLSVSKWDKSYKSNSVYIFKLEALKRTGTG